MPVAALRVWLGLGVVLFLSLFLGTRLSASSLSHRLFDSPISPLPPPYVPVVTSIEPDHGPGDMAQRVVIYGARLALLHPLVISIDNVVLQDVASEAEDGIHATVPAGIAVGQYDVQVCNAEGLCGTLPQGYTVLAPNRPLLLGIVPDRGFNDTPTGILVNGWNFKPGLGLALDGTPLDSVTWQSLTQASAVVTPGLSLGSHTLTAMNPGVSETATLPDAFTALSCAQNDLYATDDDLWTDPPTVRQGITIDLGLNVRRSGGDQTLPDVEVSFCVNALTQNQTCTEAHLADLPAGAGVVQPVTVTLDTTGLQGAVLVQATIDPNHLIDDADRDNNTVQRFLTVLPPISQETEAPGAPLLSANNDVPTASGLLVPLAISAGDGDAPTSMYVSEHVFNAAAQEWVLAQVTGWQPFTTTTSITLTDVAGSHYLQAWVADAQGTISQPSQAVLVDYAPGYSSVYAGQAQVFRYDLAQGQTLSTTVTTVNGDADVYLWGPAGNLLAFSNNSGLTPDAVLWEATVPGEYQIEVRGYLDSDFELSFSVGQATSSATASRRAAPPSFRTSRCRAGRSSRSIMSRPKRSPCRLPTCKIPAITYPCRNFYKTPYQPACRLPKCYRLKCYRLKCRPLRCRPLRCRLRTKLTCRCW